MDKKKTYTGLTAAEVEASRRQHGANVLTPPKRASAWQLFLAKFRDPLITILLVAGALSVGIACYEYWRLGAGGRAFFEPAGIFVAIFLATGIAFRFEQKANREFSLLTQADDDEAVDVVREGNVTRVARRDVVVGDIVLLGVGAEVPADGDLLRGVQLQVDESSLTGEPLCLKSARPEDADPQATYPTHRVLRGTKVMEGHGLMRVTAVGDATECGKVFTAAQVDNSVRTPLNEQLDRLGGTITKLSYVVAGAVIVLKLLVYFHWAPAAFSLLLPVGVFFWLVVKRFPRWSGKACAAAIVFFAVAFILLAVGLDARLFPGDGMTDLLAYTLQTLMIAVTLIVVAVPEGLPMAVTLSLAYSMRRMLRTNNLVRRMHACETMGAVTVICTDKTGTLTQNRMTVYEAVFPGTEAGTPEAEARRTAVQEAMALNSTAALDLHAAGVPTPVGNPTEGALLLWLRAQGVDYRALRAATDVVAELPFSAERKYMATLVQPADGDGTARLHVKGAPEVVMNFCHGTPQAEIAALRTRLLTYQQQGMRTLGFACGRVSAAAVAQLRDGGNGGAGGLQALLESPQESVAGPDGTTGLTLLGIVAISDPVRPDVPPAIRTCRGAGIEVKIVTGDTPATAREIAREVGLDVPDGDELAVITGPAFAAMDDAAATACAARLKIMARARPMDKKRLVEILQRRGEVVAVTGDGTNDAPALKAAHVGLSMGSGTRVAKEASDITIMDDSFASISRAVMWGRSLYKNIQRFLLFQLTVNVAACLVVLAGAIMGRQAPLTVTQMLWVNLIMDTFGAMALASLPPSARVMRDKPRDRRAFIIDRGMAANILGVGGFFFLLLTAFLYILEHVEVSSVPELLGDVPALLHGTLGGHRDMTTYEVTLFFSIFVWTHFWYMFNARAFRTGGSGLSLRDCRGFWLITAAIVGGQVLIVEVLGDFFDVMPLSLSDWLWTVGLTSLVLWVRELWSPLRHRLCHVRRMWRRRSDIAKRRKV